MNFILALVALWAFLAELARFLALVNEDGKIVTKDADKVIIDGHA